MNRAEWERLRGLCYTILILEQRRAWRNAARRYSLKELEVPMSSDSMATL